MRIHPWRSEPQRTQRHVDGSQNVTWLVLEPKQVIDTNSSLAYVLVRHQDNENLNDGAYLCLNEGIIQAGYLPARAHTERASSCSKPMRPSASVACGVMREPIQHDDTALESQSEDVEA